MDREVLTVIANVLQLGEEERVSLGLLSAWENQLKQMMGGNRPGPNTRPTFEFPRSPGWPLN